MNAFDLARLKARDAREALSYARSTGRLAVEKAAESAGIKVKGVPPGDTMLGTSEAKLIRGDFPMIYVRNDLTAADQAALIGHELGHFHLHQPQEECTGAYSDDASSRALSRVEVYGPDERRELQANVFAREFLLPRSLARTLFLDEKLSASEIAKLLELAPSLVRRQLIDGLLNPDIDTPEALRASGEFDPDGSQEKAATYDGKALLVEAGPGSGKTRTLVRRVEHLIQTKDVHGHQILALTFSQKAAAELSERISKSCPDSAPDIWSGSFHAFGLDLIRRHYDLMGLPPKLKLVDIVQAIELLEDRLPLLDLEHFYDLRRPEEALKNILSAISRAKDELVNAEEFAELASEAEARAMSDEEKESAKKAVEAARVYKIYEEVLQAQGAVDFGDLIMRPTRLMMENDELRAHLAQRHAHVLVDEYQDVNRASARMLMELYREGSELWVVGDARQSLYRWRGASSANMAKFEQDFAGGDRKALGINYRSTDHIVSLSRRFAAPMAAGKGGLPYDAEAKRKDLGTKTRLLVGLDDDCEAELVVEEIKALQQRGVRFADQAVLAPTNSRLAFTAAALARHKIPTSHLGSFFEREEVRDLLSVLALVSEPNGGALVRLGALVEIGVSQSDIATFIKAARADGTAVRDLLPQASAVPGVSNEGVAALEKLGRQLEGFTIHQPAFDIVASWLFDRSDYLRVQSSDQTAQGALVRAAIYRLLSFLDQSELSGRPITASKAILRVRRAILLADDRDLRDANLGRDVDSVRLMTIHGSKGLEFKAVHIVGLYDQCLPGPFKRHGLPLPEGLIEEETRATHIEEEECAFFVAISRAEDHLRLYHSEKANVRSRKCSPFVTRIGPFEQAWKGQAVFPRLVATSTISAITVDEVSMADIRDFKNCPLKVGYRWFFGIEGRRYESPYLKTSGVLYKLVDRLNEVAGPGLGTDLPELFEEVWKARGPVNHDLAADYKAHAEVRARRLGELAAGYTSLGDTHIRLTVGTGKLKVVAPLIRNGPDGTELRFFETTKVKGKTGDDLAAGLMAAATRQAISGAASISIAHLADNGVVPIRRPAAKIESDVEEAGGILDVIAKGELQPKVSSVVCARCPHFVACPATGMRGSAE